MGTYEKVNEQLDRHAALHTGSKTATWVGRPVDTQIYIWADRLVLKWLTYGRLSN